MSERRIDATKTSHDPDARLKQIAGLIRDLSYRDMRKLGREICDAITDKGDIAPHDDEGVTEGLLTWAEKKGRGE